MTSGVGSDGVLGLRALNRATLGRQMLLRRGTLPVEEAVEHLVEMQAQAPNPPYVGLWTRLEGFHPDQLARLILERRAVRIALQRNTVHLVSARDKGSGVGVLALLRPEKEKSERTLGFPQCRRQQ